MLLHRFSKRVMLVLWKELETILPFFLFWKLLNDVLALLHVVKVWKNLPMRWHWSVSHWDGLGLWSIGMTLALSHWEEFGCESLLLCFFSFIIHLSPVSHEQFHNFIFQITAFGFNPIPFINQLYTEVDLFYFSILFSFSKNVIIFLSSVTVWTLNFPQASCAKSGVTSLGEMVGPLGDETGRGS